MEEPFKDLILNFVAFLLNFRHHKHNVKVDVDVDVNANETLHLNKANKLMNYL